MVHGHKIKQMNVIFLMCPELFIFDHMAKKEREFYKRFLGY